MLYEGFRVERTFDDFGELIDERRYYVGTTNAVSQKQAENNLRYRNRGKALKSYIEDDGFRSRKITTFEAVLSSFMKKEPVQAKPVKKEIAPEPTPQEEYVQMSMFDWQGHLTF